MDEHYAWLAFSLLPGMNWQKLQLVLKHFPDLKTAWEKAGETAFEQMGLCSDLAQQLIRAREEKLWEKVVLELGKLNLGFVAYPDEDYPLMLREIAGPPLVLYFWGGLKEEPAFNVALIGSRRPTAYGLRVVGEIAKTLAQSQVGIVSGLAYGIDSEAHRIALENKGKLVGVIGSGLDRGSFYPQSNYRLAEKIVGNGGVIFSEYPPGTPALPQNFPARNRIIAGMVSAVVVIEAGEKSGALITAFLALEEGREVFAVPGRITDSNSMGTNRLIKMGAAPLLSPLDLLDHLGIPAATSPRTHLAVDEMEERILNFLAEEARHIDEVVQGLSLDAKEALSKLTLMELRGLVRSRPGGFYTKA